MTDLPAKGCRPLPTEDQRDDWHAIDLAQMMTSLCEFDQQLRYELSGCGKEHLADGLAKLVFSAYAAGRLNPHPIRSVQFTDTEQICQP